MATLLSPHVHNTYSSYSLLQPCAGCVPMRQSSTVTTLEFRKFRSRSQSVIYKRHKQFILNSNLRHLTVLTSLSGKTPDERDKLSDAEENEIKLDLNLPRRKLQISFTCNVCGVRSQRLVNPHAYARGTVFVQCAGCEVYHQLVDNLKLIEEYDFRKEVEVEQTEMD